MEQGVCPNKNEHRQGEEEEDDVDEETELRLGLSMNGRFGVDPIRNKKLKRSSSIAYLAPKAGGCVEIRADRRVLGLVSTCHAPVLARTQSLPVEKEEEWRRQKELKPVRRMEVRKKRMRTGSSGSSDLIDGWIGFFYTVWMVTRKSFRLAKHSLSATGYAISTYTTARPACHWIGS